MGPTIIFDKSTLESLNPDEAMWLDNFFISNITPLFFIETLADLEKKIRTGRTPEQIVGDLAYKTPDESPAVSIHHSALIAAELAHGAPVEMKYGRPIISGGKTVELDGKMGVFFQQSPEEEAFHRWQRKEFLDIERSQAKVWRSALSNLNLEENYKAFQRFFPMGKPKTLADIKKFVDFYIDSPDQATVLLFGLSLLGVSENSQEAVIARWIASGKPKIMDFAPYFTHVLSVDLFFNFAIAADLIGRGRPSHKVDLAYLYYLPFCNVFTSNDKLHANLAPFFLRDYQTFIPGSELKADLNDLDKFYDALPDETKQRGIMSFAFYPPVDDKFLVTRLWDKYMSPQWRDHKNNPEPKPDAEMGKKITDELRSFQENATPVSPDKLVSSDEAEHMAIQRNVYAKKGKWNRFPPEVINRKKNADGEWEDIKPSS